MHEENALALAAERERAEGVGCHFSEQIHGCCKIGTLAVTKSREGLPMGRYLSLHFPSAFSISPDEEWQTSRVLAELLSYEGARLLQERGRKAESVLFIGLGNPHATADALGPRAVGLTRPTAQLPAEMRKRLGISALSVFSPLVPTLTGLESPLIMQSLVRACAPSLVLLADAMVTEDPKRLGASFQLTDTGLCPGDGIGRGGIRIDEEFLGVPVLSVGCPTVLHASALLSIKSVQHAEEFDYLLPRNADISCSRLSLLLSRAVEQAFGLPALS